MTSTPIDGHVHFYADFSLEKFLFAAEQNFRNAMGSTAHTTGILMLATTDEERPLSRIDKKSSAVSPLWEYSRPDPVSCVFQNDRATIVLVAGRQIVTRENLELLILCSDSDFSAKLPIRVAIAQAVERQAVPVIPWGFGKWWFARGKILRGLLDSAAPHAFLLGDNGCRPALMVSPLMERARRIGVANLAGSDPLPIKSHEVRAGSFGTIVPGNVDLSSPSKWVRERLLRWQEASTFGKSRTLFQFVNDQIRIRVAKHQ